MGSGLHLVEAAWNKADMHHLLCVRPGQRRGQLSGLSRLYQRFKDLGAAAALGLVPKRLGGGVGFPLAVKMLGARVDSATSALLGARGDSVIIQQWVDERYCAL